MGKPVELGGRKYHATWVPGPTHNCEVSGCSSVEHNPDDESGGFLKLVPVLVGDDGFAVVTGLEDVRVELGDYPSGKFVRNAERAEFRVTSVLHDALRDEVSLGLVDVEAKSTDKERHFHVQLPETLLEHIARVRKARRPVAP